MLTLLILLVVALVAAGLLAEVRRVVDDTEEIERSAERLFGTRSPGLLDGQE